MRVREMISKSGCLDVKSNSSKKYWNKYKDNSEENRHVDTAYILGKLNTSFFLSPSQSIPPPPPPPPHFLFLKSKTAATDDDDDQTTTKAQGNFL